MQKEHINPPELVSGPGFHQVVTARGGKQVFIAGQLGVDTTPQLVGSGDLSEETRQALRNVETAVVAAGGAAADIVRMRLYVVDYDPGKGVAVFQALQEFAERSGSPATSIIGVAALSLPGAQVEVEATAVVEYSPE